MKKAKVGIMQSPQERVEYPNHAVKHEMDDHYLYICKTEKVYGDCTEEPLFAQNRYSKIALVEQE